MIKNIFTVILTMLTCLSCNSQQATSENKNVVQDDVYTTIHIESYEIECRRTKNGDYDIKNAKKIDEINESDIFQI